ncbi:MAG: phosphatidylserine decarboxylase [Candidatus Puniceispirillaceae bacterium]
MNIVTAIKEEMLVPIHPAGWPFIALFALVTLGISFGLWAPFAIIGVPLTLWCVYFFRNPPRTLPLEPELVIAPADGRVLSTDVAPLPHELSSLKGEYRCIAIFMNVFDVHVNRSPINATITEKHYIPGAYVNASLDKASHDNERMALILDAEDQKGLRIGVVQIAGLVARRIICERDEKDRLSAGQVFGIIRFGSRVDVWIPKAFDALVYPGQRTIAGETVIADLKPAPKARRAAKSSKTR